MKKYIHSFLVITTLSVASFGQTTNQSQNQVKNNPSTTGNQVKANTQSVTNKKSDNNAAIRKMGATIKENKLRHNSKRKRKPLHSS